MNSDWHALAAVIACLGVFVGALPTTRPLNVDNTTPGRFFTSNLRSQLHVSSLKEDEASQLGTEESTHGKSTQSAVLQPAEPLPLLPPTLQTKQETEPQQDHTAESKIETTPQHEVDVYTKQESESISETTKEAQSSSKHGVRDLFEVGISHDKEIVKMLQQNLETHVEQMHEELSDKYGEAMLEHESEIMHETDAKTMFKTELEAIAEQIVETVLGEGLEQEHFQEVERILEEESKPMYEEEHHIISVGEKEETISQQDEETILEEGLQRTHAQEIEMMLEEKPITLYEEEREIIPVPENEGTLSRHENETISEGGLERPYAQEIEMMLEEEYEEEREIIYQREEEEILLESEQETQRILEHETEILSEREEESMLQEEAYIMSEQDSEMISEHEEADLFKQQPEIIPKMMKNIHDEQHASTTSATHAHRCIFAMLTKFNKHLQESDIPHHFMPTDSVTDQTCTEEMSHTFQQLLAIHHLKSMPQSLQSSELEGKQTTSPDSDDSAGVLLRSRRSNDKTLRDTRERNDRLSGRNIRRLNVRRTAEPTNNTPLYGSDIVIQVQLNRERALRRRNRNRNRQPVEHGETVMDQDMRMSKGVHPGISPRVMNRRRLESTQD